VLHDCDEPLQTTGGAFDRALAKLTRLARDPAVPILIEGESGTGKTAIARRLHALSPRSGKPFQFVSLASIEDTLCASELFGHEAGAYTDARRRRAGHFASADGGTVFLDEIGKASLYVQRRLLHVVEYGEFLPVGSDRLVRVDVRVIAATNTSLPALVESRTFLPDLNARLELFCVKIPPLRERREEIPRLIEAVLREISKSGNFKRMPRLHEDLLLALSNAPWPNNLRQLSATVHRLIIDAEAASEITLGHCRDELTYLRAYARDGHGSVTRERAERAMRDTKNKSEAARVLGVDRTTLNRHLKRWADEDQASGA
jgi:DNA-binding NtrC family response regulator